MCGFREGFAKSMAQTIVHNLKLTAFAFPDERIALLLHILIMVFVCLAERGGDHTIQCVS